jgi:hypothetical protein
LYQIHAGLKGGQVSTYFQIWICSRVRLCDAGGSLCVWVGVSLRLSTGAFRFANVGVSSFLESGAPLSLDCRPSLLFDRRAFMFSDCRMSLSLDFRAFLFLKNGMVKLIAVNVAEDKESGGRLVRLRNSPAVQQTSVCVTKSVRLEPRVQSRASEIQRVNMLWASHASKRHDDAYCTKSFITT